MRRLFGIIVVGLAVVGGACGGSRANSGRSTVSVAPKAVPRIVFVGVDPGAAGRVAVTGGSGEERRVVDDLMPLLGAGQPITTIRFGTEPAVCPTTRSIRIALRHDAAHDRWLGSLFGEAAVARLRALGDQIECLDVPGLGSRTDGHDPSGGAVKASAQRALQRAVAAGFDTRLRVYPIGAIEATIRLDEHQLLAPKRTDWLTALVGAGPPDLAVGIDVVAPDGTSVFSISGAGTCYGCSATHPGATPGTPLPASLAGPTRLTIAVDGRIGEAPLQTTVIVDCDRGDAAAPAAGCDEIIRDRYALLPPMPSDVMCAGGAGFDSATITGVIGGVAINTSYGNCTRVGTRWIRDLTDAGLLPAPAVPPSSQTTTTPPTATGATAPRRVPRRGLQRLS